MSPSSTCRGSPWCPSARRPRTLAPRGPRSATRVVVSIWSTQAEVQPGNSGGPLVDLGGNVVGVIFAASTSQPGQAYALTDAEVQPDIDQAQGRTEAVSIGPCAM